MSLSGVIGSVLQESYEAVRIWSEEHPNASFVIQNVVIATGLAAAFSFATRMDRRLSETRRLEDLRFAQFEADALGSLDDIVVRVDTSQRVLRRQQRRSAQRTGGLGTIDE